MHLGFLGGGCLAPNYSEPGGPLQELREVKSQLEELIFFEA